MDRDIETEREREKGHKKFPGCQKKKRIRRHFRQKLKERERKPGQPFFMIL